MMRSYILSFVLLFVSVTSSHGMELPGAGPKDLSKNGNSIYPLCGLLGLQVGTVVSLGIAKKVWPDGILSASLEKGLVGTVGCLLICVCLKNFRDGKHTMLSLLRKKIPEIIYYAAYSFLYKI